MKIPTPENSMLAYKVKKFQPQLYQMCRIFGYNAKQRKLLFENVVAAAFMNLKQEKIKRSDDTLLLRACINLSIFYEIVYEADPQKKETQAVSGPYEKALTAFRKEISNMSACQKTWLYLSLHNLPGSTIKEITGIPGAEMKYQHTVIA